MSTNRDSIRIKRGMSAELPESLPLGELAFCIDTRELWVGSGDGLPLKRVTNTEITQHLEEWNLLYTEVNERFETKYHDVSSQFAEKFLDLSEQFSDKYQDLNKQFSDKFEEICVQFSTKYDNLEEHYAKDLLANKLLSQANKESIDLLKRDIGTTENIEDLREINNQATETLEQLNAVKEELQNDVLVIKDIEKDLQKASVDYSGEHHENLKDSMDANVDFILGEFNSTNMTGEHITAHNTIQRHIKNAELKGHTEVNYIKDPSDKDLVMPYPFDETQKDFTLEDTKDTGSLNIVLKGNTEVNVLKNPMRDYVVPYEFEEGYTATLTDTKETGSIQSAILKGQTLVNLKYHETVINNSKQFVVVENLIENKQYIAIFPYITNAKYAVYNMTTNKFIIGYNSSNKLIFTSPSSSDEVRLYVSFDDTSIELPSNALDIVCVEYQEGMENWDIPYFEGMQSVQMPVLTTTGKNLWDSKWYEGYSDTGGGGVLANTTLKNAFRTNYIPCSFNDKITVEIFDNTVPLNGSVIYYNLFDNNYNKISTSVIGLSSTNRTLIINNNQAKYIVFHVWNSEPFAITTEKLMVVRDDVITAYEPYKSNILTVNEEVELRGIGEVKDELNIATGELTERIGEIVLDGSENWRLSDNISEVRKCYVADLTNVKLAESNSVTTINNRMSSITYNLAIKDKQLGIFARTSTNGLGIVIDIEYLIDFKTYLQQNPITVQYVLETESIKTVDLSILDQDGLSVPALSTYNEVTYINTTVPENSLKPLISSKTPEFPVMIKPNKKYSIVADTTTNGFDEIPLTYNLGGAEVETSVGEKLTVIQTPSTLENETFKVTGTGMKLSNVMILEKDLTGKEIPNYTEGMQSVQTPVLTTTGKNLFDSTQLPTYTAEDAVVGFGGGFKSLNNGVYTTVNFGAIGWDIALEEGQTYTLSLKGRYLVDKNTDSSGFMCTIGINNKSKNNRVYGEARTITHSYTFVATKTTKIGIGIVAYGVGGTDCEIYDIQLEKTSSATTYEPFKSNILTVNEDVELRGIGDVRDELDCLTGEVTQRIGEIVLDGSEYWAINPASNNELSMFHYNQLNGVNDGSYTNLMCDKLTVINENYPYGIRKYANGKELVVTIPSPIASNVTDFKQWLSQNPITVQYQLAEPTIKTVDFTITNQNGAKVTKLSTFNDVTYISTTVAEGALNPIISHKDLEYEVLLKPNTKYSIITNPISNGHPNSPISFDLGGQQVETTVGSYCTLVTTPNSLTHNKLVMKGRGNKLSGGVMVIEGDKTGMMFNHFDGMKSVENPVMKVHNDNLFDIPLNEYDGSSGSNPLGFIATKDMVEWNTYTSQYSPSVWYHLTLLPNTQYTLSFGERTLYAEVMITDGHNEGIYDSSKLLSHNTKGDYTNFTTRSGKITIRLANYGYPTGYAEPIRVYKPMLVLGNKSIPYVPPKYNKLPLTLSLRSLPDGTKDTLNLVTGEYIRNIGHDILDGSEPLSVYNSRGWSFYGGSGNNPRSFVFTTTPGDTQTLSDNMILCDKYVSKKTLDFDSVWGFDTNHIKLGFSDPNSRFENIEEFKQHLENNPIEVCYKLGTPIVTKLDLVWEDGKLFAYDGTTHFFVDVEGGHLQPILDVDVPVNIVAELSRLRAEKEQLETSKAQLENQLEVITYRNTNLQSNLDSLVAENRDLKLQTQDLQTRSSVLQLKNKEMTKHQEKLQAENLELQKRASELAQTTMNLTEELHVVDSVRETGDLELLSSDFELDFRLMEIEFALDIPISLSVKGVSSMARTPFEMAKTLILGGKYEREDMETKLKVYRDRGKITVAEYEELIALMDANELA